MHIRQTKWEDLARVMELFADARAYMAENGNPNQWKNNHPPREQIEADINAGDSYVCVESDANGEEKIVGTFFYKEGPDPTYDVIYDGAWKSDAPYHVVHRITTDRNTRGVGSFCLNWAYGLDPNVRIDTHRDNKPMQGLLAKLGFEYCGVILLANGEERIAFQKVDK